MQYELEAHGSPTAAICLLTAVRKPAAALHRPDLDHRLGMTMNDTVLQMNVAAVLS